MADKPDQERFKTGQSARKPGAADGAANALKQIKGRKNSQNDKNINDGSKPVDTDTIPVSPGEGTDHEVVPGLSDTSADNLGGVTPSDDSEIKEGDNSSDAKAGDETSEETIVANGEGSGDGEPGNQANGNSSGRNPATGNQQGSGQRNSTPPKGTPPKNTTKSIITDLLGTGAKKEHGESFNIYVSHEVADKIRQVYAEYLDEYKKNGSKGKKLSFSAYCTLLLKRSVGL